MKPIAVLALLSCIISFSAMAEELPRTEPQPAGEPPRAAVTVPPQPPVKIGYVDIARIASDSNPGKAANARLKEKTEKLRSQITARQKKLETMKKVRIPVESDHDSVVIATAIPERWRPAFRWERDRDSGARRPAKVM